MKLIVRVLFSALCCVLCQFREVVCAPVQVSPTGSRVQLRHQSVQLPNSNIVFVWQDESSGDYDIYLRIFDSGFNPLSDPQRVNVVVKDDQIEPAVAVLDDGAFVIVFASRNSDNGYDTFFRRFTNTGLAIDSQELQVNASKGVEFKAEVSAMPGGGFVVAFTGQSATSGQDIFFRRFGARGTPLDASDVNANGLGVAPLLAGDQGSPRIASIPAGGFVIVFENRADGDVYGIRFDAGGNALDGSGLPAGHKYFPLAQNTTFDQSAPAIAALTEGGFVVAFNTEPLGTAASRSIRGRLFDQSGAGGAEFMIGSHSTRYQDARIAALGVGGFVVCYEVVNAAYDRSVFAQRFSENGAVLDPPFLVAPASSTSQERPFIAPLGTNRYLISWDNSTTDPFSTLLTAGYSTVSNQPGTLSIIRQSSSTIVLFQGQAEQNYQLQLSANLINWTTILTTNTITGNFQYADPNNAPMRFFRAITP